MYNEDGTPIIQPLGRFAEFVEIDAEDIYQSSYYDEEEDNDESNVEYMALSHKTRSEEENKFLSKFILKWMAKTERFANVISKIQFPGFLQDIDNLCPVFSDDEIKYFGSEKAVKGGTLHDIATRFPATMRLFGREANYLENYWIEILCYESLLDGHPLTADPVIPKQIGRASCRERV